MDSRGGEEGQSRRAIFSEGSPRPWCVSRAAAAAAAELCMMTKKKETSIFSGVKVASLSLPEPSNKN